MQDHKKTADGRNTARSIMSVIAGLVVIFVLSYATDAVLESAGVMESGKALPMYGSEGLVGFILAYRILFSVFGAWLTAYLAPRRPMKHALILGAIGVVFSVAGAFAGMKDDLAPGWYLWGLAVLALPSAWLGGKLYSMKQR